MDSVRIHIGPHQHQVRHVDAAYQQHECYRRLLKELAIRFSLGAGRMRMVRQLLTESLTLAALGGLVGVLADYAGLRALLVLGARELPRGGDIRLSGGALAFSAGIALLTGLVFGLAPVFHLYRRDLNEIFRGNERAGTSERGALVVCQVSLAFVLLAGAGLLTLSSARLLKVDPGFKPQHVLSARISLPPVPFWNFIDHGYSAALVAVIDQHMGAKIPAWASEGILRGRLMG
jgi:hypothetical protein